MRKLIYSIEHYFNFENPFCKLIFNEHIINPVTRLNKQMKPKLFPKWETLVDSQHHPSDILFKSDFLILLFLFHLLFLSPLPLSAPFIQPPLNIT